MMNNHMTAPQASEYDSYQLQNNLQLDPEDYDEDATMWAENFGAEDKKQLSLLADTIRESSALSDSKIASGFGLYAWACYNHAVANSAAFYKAANNFGVTQKYAFEKYLSGDPATVEEGDAWVMVFADTCSQFNCSANCDY